LHRQLIIFSELPPCSKAYGVDGIAHLAAPCVVVKLGNLAQWLKWETDRHPTMHGSVRV